MRFGLDLGGTKIEAVILDAADEIIWRDRQVTPAHDYQSILHVITRMGVEKDELQLAVVDL